MTCQSAGIDTGTEGATADEATAGTPASATVPVVETVSGDGATATAAVSASGGDA